MNRKFDEWFFTGAKATYGVFDNAAAAAVNSTDPPFTTDLTDTGHGLLAGSLLYIQGSTNYNGMRYLVSLPDANSMVIRAPYVAETLAGTETWKTMVTYDSVISSARAQRELQAGSPFTFYGFEVTLSAASATSENLTITIDAAKGSAYDNLIYSLDMDTVQHINNMFDSPRMLAPGDKIDVAWANTNARTWGIKLFTRPLV